MHVRIPIQTKINQTKQQKSEYTMLSHCTHCEQKLQ